MKSRFNASFVEIFKPIREGVSAFFLKHVSQLWTHQFPMNRTISFSTGKGRDVVP